MYEKMIFTIPPEKHSEKALREILAQQPQIRFVSLAALDMFGHATDEKIPVGQMMEDVDAFLQRGVQTDGSSVMLPGIADLSNAKVDIIPDVSVSWYVDYNMELTDDETGLPVGSLRIPSFLVHNDTHWVGSRIILKNAEEYFKSQLTDLLKNHPYVFDELLVESVQDIDHFELTAATELEFYVSTPHDIANKEQLHTSQEMKEQYWKRTLGPVRTALEDCIMLLDRYGFEVEMGHKEVGGVKAQLVQGGSFDHIMEQLEIDWKYSSPMRAADSDAQIRYLVKDVFRKHGLAVTFAAKPVEGAAGSGKHTHLGAVAVLKNGKKVNVFAPKDPAENFMSPIGYGALMGLLKNYEVINPIANCTTDDMNRLKPGYEAPISIVTSLGKDVNTLSRNRTVLIGLIRSLRTSAATHFEMRSPNPKSNTYFVVAAAIMAMMDGIKAVIEAEKTGKELEKSISKAYGEEDFYLEKNRQYRVENNIFTDYSAEQREKLFGHAPSTAWENLKAFELYPEKTKMLYAGGVMEEHDILSFHEAALEIWTNELHDRMAADAKDAVRNSKKLHGNPGFLRENDGFEPNELDSRRWEEIDRLRREIAKDSDKSNSLITNMQLAIENEEYDMASDLMLRLKDKLNLLDSLYSQYSKNLI
ncbi:MAG: glutamine synthetase [Firmicutes bacterium]|nr:glutamine synthetase [Bacillota bacterium]